MLKQGVGAAPRHQFIHFFHQLDIAARLLTTCLPTPAAPLEAVATCSPSSARACMCGITMQPQRPGNFYNVSCPRTSRSLSICGAHSTRSRRSVTRSGGQIRVALISSLPLGIAKIVRVASTQHRKESSRLGPDFRNYAVSLSAPKNSCSPDPNLRSLQPPPPLAELRTDSGSHWR